MGELEHLTATETAVWSHIHCSHPPGGLEPLTADEQAEFEPLAAMLRRAKDAGFRGRHAIIDSRHRAGHHDASEIKMTRRRPDSTIEVIVIHSAQRAQAWRMPPGTALLQAPAELDDEPGALLDLVLTGAWPGSPRGAPPTPSPASTAGSV
jgi:hypothetical protein